MEDLLVMTDPPSAAKPICKTKPAIASPRESPEKHQRLQRTQSLSATASRLQAPHTRAASVATSSPANKRLSLSFPVLPPGYSTAPRSNSSSTPPSSSGTTTPPNGGDVSPDDSAAFLTALAGQERRVLELREELTKAETELTKLKRQWANHEANKSRYEIALNSGLTSPSPQRPVSDALTSPTSRAEFERRQKAAGSGNRKVFPSQRHQRTLSLLSPEREGFRKPPSPQPTDVDCEMSAARSSAISPTKPPALKKRHTLMNSPNIREPTAAAAAAQARAQSLDLPQRPNSQEVLLKTGQQIAADFRDGLWTFLEDLRSATVGDDLRPTAPHQNSRDNIRPSHMQRVPSKASME